MAEPVEGMSDKEKHQQFEEKVESLMDYTITGLNMLQKEIEWENDKYRPLPLTADELSTTPALELQFYQCRLKRCFELRIASYWQVFELVLTISKIFLDKLSDIMKCDWMQKIFNDLIEDKKKKINKNIDEIEKAAKELKEINKLTIIPERNYYKAFKSLENSAVIIKYALEIFKKPKIYKYTEKKSKFVEFFSSFSKVLEKKIKNDIKGEIEFAIRNAKDICTSGKEIKDKALEIRTTYPNLRKPLVAVVSTVWDAIGNNERRCWKRCSHEGIHYCSDCEEEFFYPAEETEHAGHQYYETLQASLHYKKYRMLKEAKAVEKKLRQFDPEKKGDIFDQSLIDWDDDVVKYIKCHSSCLRYFRIASWNLWKLSGQDENNELFKKRLECICKTILYYQVDVIALQELFNCENIKIMMIHTLSYYSRFEWEIEEVRHKKGEHLFILFHKNLIKHGNKEIVQSLIPKIMCCEMELINGTLLKLFNTHLTYSDRNKREKELDDLKNVILPMDAERTCILLGDFNADHETISESMEDQRYHCIFHEETNTLLTRSYDNMVMLAGEKDIVRNHFVGSIMTCDELTEGKVSDHRPIIADLDIPGLIKSKV